jgi:hypothetical protein
MKVYISSRKLSAFVLFSLLCLLLSTQEVYAAGPINWFVTATVSATNSPAWGRMLPWDSRGDNLVTYTEYPSSGSPTVMIARSNPSNPAYTVIGWIPSPANHIQEQSQMVELADGTILLAMRNRQTDLNWFGLPVVKSTDGGATWNFLSQIDTNPNGQGRFDRGLWEPFLYVLPGGCIAAFYASEKHADDNPSYSQTVSERISCDKGASWGSEIFAAAQSGSARPGMPGFARMANGQYIMVYELCVTDNCNVYYKISADGRNWSAGWGTRIANQNAGPYVTVLSSGRILVTSACSNQISISDDNGASWYQNAPVAWDAGCYTWPAIYQTGYNHSNEVGVIVNVDGKVQIRFGNY